MIADRGPVSLGRLVPLRGGGDPRFTREAARRSRDRRRARVTPASGAPPTVPERRASTVRLCGGRVERTAVTHRTVLSVKSEDGIPPSTPRTAVVSHAPMAW